mmetsp:Transcript_17965/g.36250  ORF Transcript_17965/g.36250 Transcript_17965/m.36250 type:complete len:171 (-) Transcript_17965:224-736(-)
MVLRSVFGEPVFGEADPEFFTFLKEARLSVLNEARLSLRSMKLKLLVDNGFACETSSGKSKMRGLQWTVCKEDRLDRPEPEPTDRPELLRARNGGLKPKGSIGSEGAAVRSSTRDSASVLGLGLRSIIELKEDTEPFRLLRCPRPLRLCFSCDFKRVEESTLASETEFCV